MSMTIVIPMAGRGQRFIDAGYGVPKFMLKAHGKTLLEWSVDSLPLELAHKTVFVALREHEEQFGIKEHIMQIYGNRTTLAFVFLDAMTRGQAETVLRAEELIHPREALLIFNIDTMFQSTTIVKNLIRTDVDGVLGCFCSREARFSFAAADANGWVTQVTEKEPISEHALTGLYHFRHALDFLEAASEAIQENRTTKGEFYVAPLYNELLEHGARLILDHAAIHHILGTPQEYETFQSIDSSLLNGLSAPNIA